MREFNRLYSASVPDYFLDSWMSENGKFTIQREIGEGFGIFPNSNDFSLPHVIGYIRIPFDKRRFTTMRNCLETYYKIKNEL